MANSPLIDRKIEEAYGIIRETSEKKKRQRRKRKFVQTGAAAAAIVVAIGFCAANPVLAKELPLIGSVIERVQELLGFQEIPTEEIVTLVPTGQGKYNAGEREEAGDNNTGAIGIQSTETSVEATEPAQYQTVYRRPDPGRRNDKDRTGGSSFPVQLQPPSLGTDRCEK